MDTAERTRRVAEQARALGFELCGVAPATKFPELENLPEWLARGYAGEMKYLHNPKRESPELALAGARSVIVCAMNYNTALPYSTEARARFANGWEDERHDTEARRSRRGWISRYAWGNDYHEVLGAQLKELVAWMRAEIAEPHEARWYVDTGPIVERVAAKWAGLGWLGKNTCLLNEELGSWLFLGVVITTLELEPSLSATDSLGEDSSRSTGKPWRASAEPAEPAPTIATARAQQAAPLPMPDLCGQCTLCIDACPTGALVEPYVLDARRCISYLTIELRGPIPDEFHEQIGWHIFGCDICQDVCPFNRRAPVTDKLAFQPRLLSPDTFEDGARADGENSGNDSSLFAPSLARMDSMDEAGFAAQFAGSAVRRTKWQGLKRNIGLAK